MICKDVGVIQDEAKSNSSKGDRAKASLPSRYKLSNLKLMMTKARLLPGTRAEKAVKVSISKEERFRVELLKEEGLKEERMNQVLLLLEDLTRREESTVKLIMDCLYDVGSISLINKKIRIRPLNKLMKSIATLSKPAFIRIGWYWFKRKCPKLIVNWLQSKVYFVE